MAFDAVSAVTVKLNDDPEVTVDGAETAKCVAVPPVLVNVAVTSSGCVIVRAQVGAVTPEQAAPLQPVNVEPLPVVAAVNVTACPAL